MSLEEYKKELENHDWLYEMGDSIHAYNLGNFNYKRLIKISKESEQHLTLFDNIKFKEFTSKLKDYGK